VLEKNDTTLFCEVMNCGMIKLRKSVNLPNVHINLPSLTQKDKDFVKFAIDNDMDFYCPLFCCNIASCDGDKGDSASAN
jgi:pyruvate kinase